MNDEYITLKVRFWSCIIELANCSSTIQVRMMKQRLHLLMLDSIRVSAITMELEVKDEKIYLGKNKIFKRRQKKEVLML